MPRALDPEKRAEARRLRKDGDSLSKIMQALGISYGSAQRFTKGLSPEKERPSEVRAKITAAKQTAHEEWSRTVPRGECGTPGCDRPGCTVDPGTCHCGCGELAPLAPDDNRRRAYVRGAPLLYTRRCQRSANTLMAAENGDPLLRALELADLSRIEVTRLAKPKLGKGVVADLLRIEGYRLQRSYCERIVSVLREAFEAKGLDASDLTIERLFTYERPANEPPVGERARRKTLRRPPIPPNERGDGRHFQADSEKLQRLCDAEGLWTHTTASEKLGLAPSTLSYLRDYSRAPDSYFHRGRLKGREIRVGALRATVYDQRDVRRLGRELLLSDARWDRRRRDSLEVLEWELTHGRSPDEARARSGLNAKQVQVWLGHHSPAFTLATYVHFLDDDLPDADFLDGVTASGNGVATSPTEMPSRAVRDDEGESGPLAGESLGELRLV
jgi:hypothetical protein